MKALSRISMALAGLFVAGAASAGNMYINLSTNDYDVQLLSASPITVGAYDANTQTAVFNEFGFNQLLATSIYDFSDGSLLGGVMDTNHASDFANYGIPRSGTAMDDTTTVSLTTPLPGQVDIDGLEPVTGSSPVDAEGFGNTWALSILYRFNGTLGAGGPSYTSGTFEIWFDDKLATNNDRMVLAGNLLSSTLSAANLDLYFKLTYAETGFLWTQSPNGNYYDASITLPGLHLDTNVNPPYPTADQLLLVAGADGSRGAIRQTTLDGTITPVPEPASIALVGLGLLGMGSLLARRRNRS